MSPIKSGYYQQGQGSITAMSLFAIYEMNMYHMVANTLFSLLHKHHSKEAVQHAMRTSPGPPLPSNIP